MSRRQLIPRADRPDVSEAWIGWDRPLETFFVQAYDQDEELILWEGTGIRELPTAACAIALLEPFGVVPADLADLLECDRAGDAGVEDGPLQQQLKREGLIR